MIFTRKYVFIWTSWIQMFELSLSCFLCCWSYDELHFVIWLNLKFNTNTYPMHFLLTSMLQTQPVTPAPIVMVNNPSVKQPLVVPMMPAIKFAFLTIMVCQYSYSCRYFQNTDLQAGIWFGRVFPSHQRLLSHEFINM